MKKLALLLCLLSSCAFGQTAPISPEATTAQPLPKNPKAWPYDLRGFARIAGNIGGWWSMMNESDKSAFLDGYQTAMNQSLNANTILCKVFKDTIKPSSDQDAFMNEIATVANICNAGKDFSGFEKVTTKEIDSFYSYPINQPILLEWSMPYLRDKATGRKTAGQLLDALQEEQKEVHDCTKYSSLCKLGIE